MVVSYIVADKHPRFDHRRFKTACKSKSSWFLTGTSTSDYIAIIERIYNAGLTQKNKINLEFEAAVCGGVPIIRSLKEGLIANKIIRVYGIFNGTSNYILSSMDKQKKSFNDVNKKIIVF